MSELGYCGASQTALSRNFHATEVACRDIEVHEVSLGFWMRRVVDDEVEQDECGCKRHMTEYPETTIELVPECMFANNCVCITNHVGV